MGKKLKPYCFLLLLTAAGLLYFGSENRQRWLALEEAAMEEAAAQEAAKQEAAEREAAERKARAEAAEEARMEREAAIWEKEAHTGEPIFGTVTDAYFDDAVFIGDSRTVALYDYANLENSTFYCFSGLTIYKLFQDPGRRRRDGNWPESIETALQENSFKKIYIMLGINELESGDAASFAEEYGRQVEKLKELQPDAVIYIQSIMRVTSRRSRKGDYISNAEIDRRNEAIRELADQKTVFYLDVNSAVCDEDGNLRSDYSGDGVHLYARYVDIWVQYLREHALLGFS